jgi:lysophospholipase L1-like esterase
MRKALIISNIILLTLLTVLVYKYLQNKPKSSCTYSLQNFKFHYEKESDSANILMLGNSLVEMADWPTLLGRSDVINRGIAGDKLECICKRLQYLKNIPAKICFIEGGINDLPATSIDILYNQYIQIVDSIKAQNKIPVINAVLYISHIAGRNFPSRENYTSINGKIKELNLRLKFYADKNHIDLINLNPILTDGKELKDFYTIDGVHLNSTAYKIWSEQIQMVLEKFNI